mmetsp:Transcript_29770/g.41505  ORF Transcript_29770/g.41505 Transcript_29770/m.41505 type:complete len:131 (-) Transcript_29770:153-545(-)
MRGHQAAEELPVWMWKAVKPGGRIVMPLGPEHGPQYLCYVDKNKEQSPPSSSSGSSSKSDGNEEIEIHKLFKVLYVPMTDPKWQKDRWEFIEVDSYDDDDDDDDDGEGGGGDGDKDYNDRRNKLLKSTEN